MPPKRKNRNRRKAGKLSLKALQGRMPRGFPRGKVDKNSVRTLDGQNNSYSLSMWQSDRGPAMMIDLQTNRLPRGAEIGNPREAMQNDLAEDIRDLSQDTGIRPGILPREVLVRVDNDVEVDELVDDLQGMLLNRDEDSPESPPLQIKVNGESPVQDGRMLILEISPAPDAPAEQDESSSEEEEREDSDDQIVPLREQDIQKQPAKATSKLHKAKRDKYFTLGMRRQGGLGKDMNYTGLATNKEQADTTGQIQGLVYMNEAQRQQFLVTVQNGLLYQNGQLMDTTHISNNTFLFVMDGQGRIFSADKGQVEHHSSILAGNPAAAAGMIVVRQGKLEYYNDQSGHYQPPKDFMDQFVKELRSRGVDFSNVEVGKGMLSVKQIRKRANERGITMGERLYPSGPRLEGF